MAQTTTRALTSSLDKLKIAPKSTKAEPAESWEDEDDSGTEEDSGTSTPVRAVKSSDYPGPPPPTPSSPSFSSSKTTQGLPYQTFPPYGFDGVSEEHDDRSPVRRAGDDRRPEKSTAVASRLIAAGIGQKAPRRTKEQREYDQAMKVQEKKRREQAKVDEERKKMEKEKAKQAIWDD